MAGEADYNNDDSSSVGATANTGKQDSSSIWGSGLISGITSLGTGAIGAYQTLNGKPAATPTPGKPATPPPATAAPASAFTKYLPYIIGAVVLLVGGGLLLRRRR